MKPKKENICAIIVTYFPDAQFATRLERIHSQVGKTIIIDNTGEAAAPDRLPKSLPDIELIRNKENLGIGAALNQGMNRAVELGYSWAITFDQDSWVKPELVETLLHIYDEQPLTARVGILGCDIEDENVPSSRDPQRARSLFYETRIAITSGSLMPLAVYTSAGGFREDFFIDFVDFEYCLRLRKLGYKVIRSTAPLMVHALGSPSTVPLVVAGEKLSLVLTNRSPLRRYYMTRNAILVAKEYGMSEPRWVFKTLASILGFALLKIPFEKSNRWKKFRATVSGAIDGLRSKTGEARVASLKE